MKIQSALDKVTCLSQPKEQAIPKVQYPAVGTLNTENLDIALTESDKSPRLCLYSPKVVAALTYLKLSNPELVMSQEVNHHLEARFAKQYPVLWEEISKNFAKKRRAAWSKRKKSYTED
jgi:hypothetical protein